MNCSCACEPAGTFADGERLERKGQVRLVPGRTRFTLGRCPTVFSLADEAAGGDSQALPAPASRATGSSDPADRVHSAVAGRGDVHRSRGRASPPPSEAKDAGRGRGPERGDQEDPGGLEDEGDGPSASARARAGQGRSQRSYRGAKQSGGARAEDDVSGRRGSPPYSRGGDGGAGAGEGRRGGACAFAGDWRGGTADRHAHGDSGGDGLRGSGLEQALRRRLHDAREGGDPSRRSRQEQLEEAPRDDRGARGGDDDARNGERAGPRRRGRVAGPERLRNGRGDAEMREKSEQRRGEPERRGAQRQGPLSRRDDRRGPDDDRCGMAEWALLHHRMLMSGNTAAWVLSGGSPYCMGAPLASSTRTYSAGLLAQARAAPRRAQAPAALRLALALSGAP